MFQFNPIFYYTFPKGLFRTHGFSVFLPPINRYEISVRTKVYFSVEMKVDNCLLLLKSLTVRRRVNMLQFSNYLIMHEVKIDPNCVIRKCNFAISFNFV